MSDRFFEDLGRDINSFNTEVFEDEIDVEYNDKICDFLKSPLYQREKSWLDSEWSQKVLDVITNPAIIIAAIIISASGILIFGGYHA